MEIHDITENLARGQIWCIYCKRFRQETHPQFRGCHDCHQMLWDEERFGTSKSTTFLEARGFPVQAILAGVYRTDMPEDWFWNLPNHTVATLRSGVHTFLAEHDSSEEPENEDGYSEPQMINLTIDTPFGSALFLRTMNELEEAEQEEGDHRPALRVLQAITNNERIVKDTPNGIWRFEFEGGPGSPMRYSRAFTETMTQFSIGGTTAEEVPVPSSPLPMEVLEAEEIPLGIYGEPLPRIEDPRTIEVLNEVDAMMATFNYKKRAHAGKAGGVQTETGLEFLDALTEKQRRSCPRKE
jgi:hypothetical protein